MPNEVKPTQGVKHPAPYTKGLIPLFATILQGHQRVLDPFAGTGRIHELQQFGFETVGVEIEPEWAGSHKDTLVGDVLDLPGPLGREPFDAICTSPCYGNRFADAHEAKDGSTRRSYTHDLGRRLHANNAGAMQWGAIYRSFHEEAWQKVAMCLKPGGLFVLNIKDHIRGRKRQYVAGWHVTYLTRMGLELEYHVPLPAPGMRKGENNEARVEEEQIYVFRG